MIRKRFRIYAKLLIVIMSREGERTEGALEEFSHDNSVYGLSIS